MSEPKLTILGVYKPVISNETWQRQWQVTGDDAITKEHFTALVLIEGTINELPEPFDMGKFGQLMPTGDRWQENMQVGYDEGLISEDGETLLVREMNCARSTGPLRFAVYLHYYDPGCPLVWQYGEVICPPVQDVPVRLQMLMPYIACD
jgi:hypothetical protein